MRVRISGCELEMEKTQQSTKEGGARKENGMCSGDVRRLRPWRLFLGRTKEMNGNCLQVFGVSIQSTGQGGQDRRLPGKERFMKFVSAIIKPFKLNEVRESLTALGVRGVTVTEVKGFGRQKGHTEMYRGAEYVIEFIPKLKVEVAIDDSQLEQVVEGIKQAARTDKIGDGKIFVFDLEQVMRIRTGETGSEAL
jgi:nitrogen regulatory protein P-II 2